MVQVPVELGFCNSLITFDFRSEKNSTNQLCSFPKEPSSYPDNIYEFDLPIEWQRCKMWALKRHSSRGYRRGTSHLTPWQPSRRAPIRCLQDRGGRFVSESIGTDVIKSIMEIFKHTSFPLSQLRVAKGSFGDAIPRARPLYVPTDPIEEFNGGALI